MRPREWTQASDDYDLDRIFLAAPSSTPERLSTIVDASRGFVYAASTMGVTGVRSEVDNHARDLVSRLKDAGAQRACVGLGVSTREQAAEVAEYADGVIVGSALVRALDSDGVPVSQRWRPSLQRAVHEAGPTAHFRHHRLGSDDPGLGPVGGAARGLHHRDDHHRPHQSPCPEDRARLERSWAARRERTSTRFGFYGAVTSAISITPDVKSKSRQRRGLEVRRVRRFRFIFRSFLNFVSCVTWCKLDTGCENHVTHLCPRTIFEGHVFNQLGTAPSLTIITRPRKGSDVQ